MCKKLTYVLLLASLMTGVNSASADLIGWWKLDEGSGTAFLDSTNYMHDGTIAPQNEAEVRWSTAGYKGSCLDCNSLNANTVVCSAPLTSGLLSMSEATASFWMNIPTVGYQGWGIIIDLLSASSDNDIELNENANIYINFNGPGIWVSCPSAALNDNSWHHVTVTCSSSANTLAVYLDGRRIFNRAYNFTQAIANVRLGTRRQYASVWRRMAGRLDEVAIFNTALSAAEIQNLIWYGPQWASYATSPSPANKATMSTAQVTLAWTAGQNASKHHVYIGDDPNNVKSGIGGTDKGLVQQASYAGFPWQIGKTYYWRVDEVEADGATTHPGVVWSFTVSAKIASNPVPANGAVLADPNVTLSWTTGSGAVSRDVYFGTNPASLTRVAQNLTATTHDPSPSGILNYNTIYYWRIDEFDGTTKYPGDVWSFKTVPNIPVTDPNLVGRYTFDADETGVVIDWSGRGNHSTLRGQPLHVAGYQGSAMQFDGVDDAFELTPMFQPVGSEPRPNSFTLMAWINTATAGRTGTTGRAGSGLMWSDYSGGGDHFLVSVLGTKLAFETGPPTTTTVTNRDVVTGDWVHVAVTRQSSGQIEIFVDGVSDIAATQTGGLVTTASPRMAVGGNLLDSRYFTGLMDEVRIYDRVLARDEIDAASVSDPNVASKPVPSNGSLADIDLAANLSWTAGAKAAKHDVYFGTDANAVKNAATATAGVYRGRQGPTTYHVPDTLQVGKTYYWRVDEYNTDATISKGRLWTFTIATYRVVDDFEAYDANCVRLYYTWRDSLPFEANPACGVNAYSGNQTGATVGNNDPPYVEQSIVHNGRQSMPVRYFNVNPPYYSEAQRQWAAGQDWTKNGVKSLTLWFRGLAANAPTTLYIIVQDNLNKSKTFTYPDPNAAARTTWQEWVVDLKELTNAGVNPASITKMTIGMDNRANIQTAGNGTMYFDDILLYQPRCRPDFVKPNCDLNNDCIVDYRDLDLMANDWLLGDQVLATTPPATTGLVGYWPLDGNTNDASGSGNNAQLIGGPVWTTGQISGAIQLDGVDDFVNCGASTVFDITSRVTLAAWVKTADSGNGQYNPYVSKGDTSYALQHQNGNNVEFYIYESGAWPNVRYPVTNAFNSAWHHVAGTYDGAQLKLYVDGVLRATTDRAGAITPNTFGVNIGSNSEETTRFYAGLIDDVRIYSRALSAAEVAYLADSTPADGQLHVPVPSLADFFTGEAAGSQRVNFKDYAVLASEWLKEQLWP